MKHKLLLEKIKLTHLFFKGGYKKTYQGFFAQSQKFHKISIYNKCLKHLLQKTALL